MFLSQVFVELKAKRSDALGNRPRRDEAATFTGRPDGDAACLQEDDGMEGRIV